MNAPIVFVDCRKCDHGDRRGYTCRTCQGRGQLAPGFAKALRKGLSKWDYCSCGREGKLVAIEEVDGYKVWVCSECYAQRMHPEMIQEVVLDPGEELPV